MEWGGGGTGTWGSEGRLRTGSAFSLKSDSGPFQVIRCDNSLYPTYLKIVATLYGKDGHMHAIPVCVRVHISKIFTCF